jgi:hypothetical protein
MANVAVQLDFLFWVQNPKDPLVRRQRAIMMSSEEKRFVRGQHCFLIRNMLGKVPILAPKKPSSNASLKTLLPFKTEEKISPDRTSITRASQKRIVFVFIGSFLQSSCFLIRAVILQSVYKVPSKSETSGEEVIRCICGVVREEGDMLMCDKCEVRLVPFILSLTRFVVYFSYSVIGRFLLVLYCELTQVFWSTTMTLVFCSTPI